MHSSKIHTKKGRESKTVLHKKTSTRYNTGKIYLGEKYVYTYTQYLYIQKYIDTF